MKNQNLIKNANGTQNLMTGGLAKQFPAILAQDGKGDDAIAYAKFFLGSFTWYATEYEPKTGEMFGKVFSHLCPDGELGSFYLHGNEDSLSTLKARGLFAVERDTSFKPTPIKSCKNPCAA